MGFHCLLNSRIQGAQKDQSAFEQLWCICLPTIKNRNSVFKTTGSYPASSRLSQIFFKAKKCIPGFQPTFNLLLLSIHLHGERLSKSRVLPKNSSQLLTSCMKARLVRL